MTAHEASLRRHYARTSLAAMGIEYERGMQREMVRFAVEGAARDEARRTAESKDNALRAA